MTDTPPVPYLLKGQRITRPDGALDDWFINGWNDLLDRVGGQKYNSTFGVINGSISTVSGSVDAVATEVETARGGESDLASKIQSVEAAIPGTSDDITQGAVNLFLTVAERSRIAALSTAGAAVAGTTIVYTAADPGITPDNSVTIANGALPTTPELLELCVELRAQIETMKARLEALGLITP